MNQLPSTWKKNISLFITAQNFFLFGSSAVYFAILWFIALKSSSGTWMMLATLATTLPQILISLFAGTWSDRYDRRRLLVLSSTFVTAATIILAIVYFWIDQSLWILLGIAAIRSLGTGISTPVGNAFFPQLIPKKQITRMNGVNQTISSILLLISPLLSGYILNSLGMFAVFIVDLITAGVGIGLILNIKTIRSAFNKPKSSASSIADIKTGLYFTFKNHGIRNFLLFTAVAFILIAPSSQLSTLFVKRTFGSNVWFLTLNELLWTIGSALGGLFISLHQQIPNKIRWIAVGFIGSGICFTLMGVSSSFTLYLFFMFGSGIFMPIIQGTTNILIQESVPDLWMGRVFSLLQIVSTGIYPIAMLFFGPLADFTPIKWIMVVTGILLVLVAFLFNIRLKNKLLCD